MALFVFLKIDITLKKTDMKVVDASHIVMGC
jgi:hypothetical protein